MSQVFCDPLLFFFNEPCSALRVFQISDRSAKDGLGSHGAYIRECIGYPAESNSYSGISRIGDRLNSSHTLCSATQTPLRARILTHSLASGTVMTLAILLSV